MAVFVAGKTRIDYVSMHTSPTLARSTLYVVSGAGAKHSGYQRVGASHWDFTAFELLWWWLRVRFMPILASLEKRFRYTWCVQMAVQSVMTSGTACVSSCLSSAKCQNFCMHWWRIDCVLICNLLIFMDRQVQRSGHGNYMNESKFFGADTFLHQ